MLKKDNYFKKLILFKKGACIWNKSSGIEKKDNVKGTY